NGDEARFVEGLQYADRLVRLRLALEHHRQHPFHGFVPLFECDAAQFRSSRAVHGRCHVCAASIVEIWVQTKATSAPSMPACQRLPARWQMLDVSGTRRSQASVEDVGDG